jgi:Flp pilus assembly protein TadD
MSLVAGRARRSTERRSAPALLLFLLAALAAAAAPAAPAAPILKPGGSAEEVIRANNRGTALMEQFKHAQAEEAFASVTAAAPGWAPGFANLGLAAFYARDHDRAETAFREALRLDPSLPQAHYGLALLLKNDGKSDEAIAEMEQVRAGDAEDPDVLYNLGLLEARRRAFDKAVPLLKRAREIDPNNLSIRYQLARALLQSGQPDAGQKEMTVYQRLSANPAFAVPTGNQYGEGGRYALVSTDYRAFGGPPPPPAPVAVRFSDATEASGITFVHAGPGGEMDGGAAAGAAAGRRAAGGAVATAARYGSGIAIGDLDGDGRPDLVFANASADGKARPTLVRNRGDGTFEDITVRSNVVFEGIGTTVLLGDYDNDDDLDLFLAGLGKVALYANQGKGVFQDVTAKAGLSLSGLPLGGVWADVDHDGDLDLFLCRAASPGAGRAGALLFQNRGDGTFLERASELHLSGPATGCGGAVAADFDADRDIDLAVSALGGPDALLDNRRESGFADRGRDAGLAARGAGRGVSAGDLNGDGLPDLVFATGPGEPLRVYLGGPRGRFTAREIPKPREASVYGLVLFDADNDGDLDLFATGSAHLLYLNDGAGGFRDASASSGLTTIAVRDGRGAAAADLDGDGDLDLVVTRNGGRAMVLRNEGGSRNHWLSVDPRGLNSNHDGVGAKIDVQTGALWQRREIQAGSGYLSQSPAAAHFGLGDRTMADFVRLVWPGGVLQSELDVPAGQTAQEAELDRKGSSCPLLFAWNGGRYTFVTDFLGTGGIGMWMAPGVYGQPDPDEYVKIEPDQLLPRDGGYLLQVVENLEEVTYLDEAKLHVVDHPKGVDVWPNERFGSREPPAHRLYAVERDSRIFPAHAVDDDGREVSDRLAAIDRVYPDGFRLGRLAGFAAPHRLDLEFPESVTKKEGLVLFLYGWVDFEYASSNFAAYQGGVSLESPVLEVEGADGLYHPYVEPMGFPAGLPRMMTVELPPGPLPSRRLRIRTNMRVFWDQIFLARPLPDEQATEKVKVNVVSPSGAHLHRRGFPREHSPDGREPKVYDYAIMDNTAPFKTMAGDYTKFGRVTDLLGRTDDQFVVFGRGEEVTLEFPVKGLPRLPQGSVRSFLLYANGYCKDMDPHTAFPDTVEPLPFHGMSAYPYPEGESYPDDAGHREYRKTWNTRHVEAH